MGRLPEVLFVLSMVCLFLAIYVPISRQGLIEQVEARKTTRLMGLFTLSSFALLIAAIGIAQA